MQLAALAEGICHGVFFVLSPVAAFLRCQEKLLMLALLQGED